ncbi:ABC transporter substrate-binding protein [Paenibacillus sp. HW567]|uniref:ABC transporter substrate-binding protein n=1 Tax=Paenibacillus sp. HW567 TaxID=1034769 RepID=UPI00037229A0|nr:ABC transporter substrate-binding protein [Paenibacillus sp. HW567]
MQKIHTRLTMLSSLLLFMLLLSACSGNANNSRNVTSAADSKDNVQTSAPSSSPSAETFASGKTRKFTDSKGREVEIPVNPQKIVYVGSDPGDLLVLGVKPIGASLTVIASQVAYPELLEGIEDVGYPSSPEKILSLNPDLIIFSDWDEKLLEPLSSIAPTVVIGEGDTYVRLRQIADVLGKQDIAEQKIADYETDAASVKEQLKLKLKSGETATVFLQLGKTLYVMGHQGISVSLYDMLGFTPNPKVQELINQGERFSEISEEVLPSYSGDVVFVLGDKTNETSSALDGLLNSAIWKSIPAVKNGQMYYADSKWNFDDLLTRTRLLEELPKLMAK